MYKVDQQATFMDRYASGAAMVDEIDDYVDRWHNVVSSAGSPELSLSEYLGMTADEYGAWVRDASVLPEILRARRERRPSAVVAHK